MPIFRNNKAIVDNTIKKNSFLYLERAKALILYPSLCMPVTVVKGGKFIVILQVNRPLINSHKIITSENRTLMQRRINLQLKYYNFKDVDNVYAGKSFESLPEIRRVLQVPKNKDVVLKDDEHNFECILAKDALSVYKNLGYQELVMLSQDCTLEEPSLLQWLDVIDSGGERSISNIEHKSLITNKLHNMGVEIDILNGLKNIHPIFPIGKEEVGVAHLSDLHISSRVSVLQKNSQLKNVDGGSVSDKIHNPIDSIRQLLWSFGEDERVTCIWVTGDVVDFHINISDKNIMCTDPINIWNSLNVDLTTIKEKGQLYTDVHSFYNLVVKFYYKFKKPIYFLFGNHDAYEMPYGISPRMLQSRVSKKGIKANATIPMDHNLTFYEAILLFGPGYNNIVTNHT